MANKYILNHPFISDGRVAVSKLTHIPMEEYLRMTAELKRLRDIVAKLPTTADGVPIVPGMTLYTRTDLGGKAPWIEEYASTSVFLEEADAKKMTPRELDYLIWSKANIGGIQ